MGKIRKLLYPFSVLYGLGVRLRNRLYDRNILRSAAFDLPVICVGNLSTGGTGKTPMVEYLLASLSVENKLAVLSRGYKRRTKGFLLADERTKATDIGDEPFQIHQKFPDVAVAVSAERITGVPQILQERPETTAIILDDAFQHRPVRAGLNILLTPYAALYSRDLLLPAGNLRDTRSSSRRADIIVVTKCPRNLSKDEARSIRNELNPRSGQQVFYSTLKYGAARHIFTNKTVQLDSSSCAILVTGIADPRPLETEVRRLAGTVEHISYRDHHAYTVTDMHELRKRFDSLPADDKMIITTEKDAVKLSAFKELIGDLPIYVLPVAHEILFGEGPSFERLVHHFVNSFPRE